MKKKFYILFFVLLSVVRSYAQPFVYPGDAPLTTDFATTAPTVNDDEGDGYKVGSRIWDITADEEYVCLDPTAGAAVWEKTSIDLTSELTVDSSLIPDTDNSYDLGSDSYQWKDLYLSNAIIVKGAFCIPSKVNEVAGISIGQVVYISGATENKPKVSLADNTLHNKTHIFGIAAETKADGENICIAIAGEISGVNTNGMTEGDRLHMTTGGNWQVAVPTSGTHIHVGRVTKVNASTGIFELIVDQYIHDIRATTDIDIGLATGADDATRKISFQDYSANELGYIDGTGLFEWNGQGLFSELEVESTDGLVIPASSTAAFSRKGDLTTGLFFNVSGPWYEFRRSGSVVAKIKAVVDQGDIVSNRNMIVGVGAVGVDYHIAFDGEDNDGIQRWKEDEDYFLFLDDALMQTTEKLYFRNTAIGIYSQAGTFLDLFGVVRIGNSSGGAPTTYFAVEPDGDTYCVGEGTGWPRASVYGNEIAWTQAAAVQNTWYIVSDADMTTGRLNETTHDGNGQITVARAGDYEVHWYGAFEANAANVHIQVAPSINGAAPVGDALNHFETFGVSRQAPCGGDGILDLAANDTVEMAIRTTDAGTPNLAIDHLGFTLKMDGGT